MFFLLALVVAIIGAAPVFVAKRWLGGIILFAVSLFVSWFFFWLIVPTFIRPVFGFYGFMVFIWWIVAAIINSIDTDYSYGNNADRGKLTWILPCLYLLIVFGTMFVNSSIFHAEEYASFIGQVEERVWTNDIQPKDPQHIRLVTPELALYKASNELGMSTNILGSQFNVSLDQMVLQRVDSEFWYIAPLDFNGYPEWTKAKTSPGYVKILAEDPNAPVQLILNLHQKYTLNACLGNDLVRYLWQSGYRNIGLADYQYEVDESWHPYYVVTKYTLNIGYWGRRITGVLTVDPESGEINEYDINHIPAWIDRVVPQYFVSTYIDDWGGLSGGWWNCVWGSTAKFEGETPTINYGSNGEPLWTTTLTSTSSKDKSMIGLVYTDSRTGKSVRYKASGGTEERVLQAVDNKVVFKHFHGSGPVLYNIYGSMASIVPILGENHTFQGVAIVDVSNSNLPVAEGADQYIALREYQKILAAGGRQLTPELAHNTVMLTGIVDRFSAEQKTGETHYYFYLKGHPMLFTGVSELSSRLTVTRDGDQVEIQYIDSKEDVVPMLAFSNHSVPTEKSANQVTLEVRQQQRQKGD